MKQSTVMSDGDYWARGSEVEALGRGAAGEHEPQEVGGRREGDGDCEQRVVGGGVEHGGQRHRSLVSTLWWTAK